MELLLTLYGEVWLPPAVLHELEAVYQNFPLLLGGEYSFLKVRAPVGHNQVNRLLLTLDQGEAEAITLALEIGADHLLIDELDGRSSAQQMGLNVTGVLGVLSRAKREKLVAQVRPLIEELEHGLGFFIGRTLKAQTLKALGE